MWKVLYFLIYLYLNCPFCSSSSSLSLRKKILLVEVFLELELDAGGGGGDLKNRRKGDPFDSILYLFSDRGDMLNLSPVFLRHCWGPFSEVPLERGLGRLSHHHGTHLVIEVAGPFFVENKNT